jgi:hypothetical protein
MIILVLIKVIIKMIVKARACTLAAPTPRQSAFPGIFAPLVDDELHRRGLLQCGISIPPMPGLGPSAAKSDRRNQNVIRRRFVPKADMAKL